jgi:MoaA/NifB/PqqE/SkfB family radical SAM enzyme
MTQLKPSGPEFVKKFNSGKPPAIYMFLPQVEPACNSRCTGCYVLASESYANRVRRSETQVLADVRGLVAKGYSVLLSTTEVLMNPNYLDLLTASKATAVMTNGKAVVADPGMLDKLKGIGITQLVLTANFQNSGLILTAPGSFRRATSLIQAAELGLMVRITLTKANLESAPAMVAECAKLGITTIQFLRFMPLEKGPETLGEQEVQRFFEMLASLRTQYPAIFLSAGGTLGSQFRKKKFACPAGKTQFVVGVDNNIYPCIFLTQKENRLGRFVDRELRVERTFDAGGDPLECPAYVYLSRSLKEKKL